MKTKKLTTCAMMIALSTVLMLVSKVIPSPWLQGGSITLASMVPIIALSNIYGYKWGQTSVFAYSLIQMMFGFSAPPTQNFISFFLVVMLDYIIAFSVLGLSGIIFNLLGKKRIAIPISGAVVTFLRYVCHILSGVLIWGVYAPEGQPVWLYSLVYNGGYMLPEIIITTIVLSLLSKFIYEKAKNN